jgi:hypothetical protein
MSGRTRPAATRRWTPDNRARAQYAALALVFFAALVIMVLRTSALLSG